MLFLLSGIAEILGFLITLFGTKLSKRSLLCFALFFAGLSLLLAGIIPEDNREGITLNKILTVFSVINGKMLISSCLYLVYIYYNKIFPTSVRNTLVSFIICSGRLGAIIAPQVNLLKVLVWSPMPYYVFGIISMLSSGLVAFLPNEENIKHDI